MSSSFEDKLWKFAETFAKTMNNSAQKKERDLDRRFENGTISDEDYWEQSKKAINTQVDAADILERCRNRNSGKFIHASTSQGVIVSNLREKYYTQHWLCGGRIK